MELLEALNKVKIECKALKNYLINNAKIDRFADIFVDKTDDVVVSGVYVGSRNFMVRINERRNEVIFRDDLSTPVAVECCWGIDRETIEPLYNELMSLIRKSGGEIKNSRCGGNDDYDWMDLCFKLNEFTIEKLEKCEKLWSDYNKCVDTIVKNR